MWDKFLQIFDSTFTYLFLFAGFVALCVIVVEEVIEWWKNRK